MDLGLGGESILSLGRAVLLGSLCKQINQFFQVCVIKDVYELKNYYSLGNPILMQEPTIQTADLDKDRIPAHVAVIMDGNGRWAESRSRPRVWGHQKGAEAVRQVVEIAGEIGVKVLTLFAFSEENWGRPQFEINSLMGLLDTYLLQERAELARRNVRFRTIGNLHKLPEKTKNLITDTEKLLAGNTGLVLNIALSYGGRDEIVSACKEISKQIDQKNMRPDDIDKDLFSRFLWTGSLPDPDLLIRTSGEHRISNFLLWQSAYTEFYFTQCHWPDFGKEEFCQAIFDYQSRCRRFGAIGPKEIKRSSQPLDDVDQRC